MPLAVAALAASLAAGTAPAQSIKITSVTPASGNLPMSGAGVVIQFDYNLAGTPDGQVAAFLKSAPAPGPGQVALGESFAPVWLTASQTSGHAQISLTGYCQDATTVPSGNVSEVSVVLSKSGHYSGPIGPQLAKDTKAVNFAYACPGAANTSQGRGRPDITSKKGITIGGDVGGAGGKFSAWGGHVNLVPADTKLPVGNGKCAFNVMYDITNAGTVATGPVFRNDLKEDGNVVSQTGMLHLDAGQTMEVKTQAYLSPGTHVLSVYLDNGGTAPNHEVPESDETNNVFGVKFTLDASCKPALSTGPVKAPGQIVVPTPTIAQPR
jgi:hypothetical protein